MIFDYLFEDEFLLAINKPPGLLVVPDRFNKLEKSIIVLLQEKYKEIYSVHRLDRDTSGVLIFAKNIGIQRDLNIQFEKHRIIKTYLVLVNGNIINNEGVLDFPLAKKTKYLNEMVIDKSSGKPSLTKYKVIQRFGKFTYLEAYPQTGRTHQIRVHFKAIGHPLVIDKIYSNRDKIFLSDVVSKFKGTKNEAKPIMDRMTLHAHSLEFVHPVSFVRMKIEAPLWKDFKTLIKNLEKYR